MSGILSQQEIDSLLSGFPTREDHQHALEKTEKSYSVVSSFDFRLPRRLTPRQMRTLQTLHESFAENFESYLSSRLHVDAKVSVTSVAQYFYSEYAERIESPTSLYIFRLAEFNSHAFIEVRSELALAIVSRLLGGMPAQDAQTRVLTKIEQNLIKGISLKAIAELQNAWKALVPVTFLFERYEVEAEFAKVVPPADIVLLMNFQIAFDEHAFSMSLCIPAAPLETTLAKLDAQQSEQPAAVRGNGEWADAILRKLETTPISAHAVLGSTTLALGDLLELEPGDVIRTNIPVNGVVEIIIGGKRKLRGLPGISNGKFSVKITHIEPEPESGE